MSIINEEYINMGCEAFAVAGGLYREGSPYDWALAVNMVIVAIGVVCLACSLFQPDYRRVLSWGDSEETLGQLYRELVEQEPLVKTDIGFLTDQTQNEKEEE